MLELRKSGDHKQIASAGEAIIFFIFNF